MSLVVSFGMYDWREAQAEVDAAWSRLRHHLALAGIEAPEHPARRNRDLPPVPGGIRDAAGHLLAPDPAELPPDDLDLRAVWHHPQLLLAEICHGVLDHAPFPGRERVGQLDYTGISGGIGPLYASALICRPEDEGAFRAALPGLPSGKTFALNGRDSLSGFMALREDLARQGVDLETACTLFETGSHRASVQAVADGTADFAAIDIRSWHLARHYEPAAATLAVFGETAHREGIALISRPDHAGQIRQALDALRRETGAGAFPVGDDAAIRL